MDNFLYLKNKEGEKINFYFLNSKKREIEVEIVRDPDVVYFYLETQQIVKLASFLNGLIKTHNLEK